MNKDLNGNPKEFRRDRLLRLVKYKEIREELIQQGGKSEILSQLFVSNNLAVRHLWIEKGRFLRH